MTWHINQSNHNLDSNKYLAQANLAYRDWEIITLFYSAVHIVDNYFFLAHRKKPKIHYERRKLVCSQLIGISSEYGLLEQLSRDARYDLLHHNLTPDQVKSAIEYHTNIAAFVQNKLQWLGLI